MRKKIIGIFAFMLILLSLCGVKSLAVVTATSVSVTSGNNATVTVNATELLGAYTLSLIEKGGLTLADYNGGDGEEGTPNGKETISYASSSGVKRLGVFTFKTPNVDSEKKYTVKFSATGMEKTDTSEINNESPIAVITVKPATTSEAKYSNVNQKVYARVDTNVRESASTSSKSLGMLQAGNEVTRIGVGDNGWSKVTYNGKTAYIYSNNLVTTKPEDTKSMDKALKSLKVAEGTLEPEFSPDTTKYSVSVANNIEIATIEALANSDKAKVEITGNEKLVMGSNMVKITVTAEDGTTRIYNLEIVKTNQDPAQLTKLSIPGVKLNPDFKPDIYNYTIQLDAGSTVTDFGIQTETNIKDATVEIIGNSNFKEGENIITILVTSADGKEKSSYQIVVNKPGAGAGNLNNSKNKTANIALIAIGILALAAISIVVFTIIKRKRAESALEDDEDDADPYRPSFKNDDEDLESDEEARKEDFTGVYKHQIMSDDEMVAPQITGNTDRFQTPEYYKNEETTQIEEKQEAKPQDDDYVPDMKPEKNLDNMEMTRRISTNYDYTLEQYKKSKNTGKGRHF